MNIEEAKINVDSKIKKYKIVRRKDTLKVMYQLYLTELILGSSSILCVQRNMKENSLILGSVALAFTVPTTLLTTSEYKKHKLTYEIVRLKRVKSFLKKGINILEDTSVEEFNKEKCL